MRDPDRGAAGDCVTRRRALLVLAAGALSSGCGGTGAASSGESAGACTAPAGGGGGALYCLVQPKIVRVKGAKGLAAGEAMLTNVDDNTAVIVARDDQGFHALSAICTHACCLVSLCRDDACTQATGDPGACGTSEVARSGATGLGAVCPCHGSSFRLVDGKPDKGPALKPLPSLALSFDGEDGLVDTSMAVDAALRI